jgi:flagellar assembly factor FliW
MHVQTTRFGVVEIDDGKVISFAAGLLGFSSYRRYVLLQPDDDAVFFWLQSVDAPELAFVVTDPCTWVSGYEVPIRKEQMEQLGLARLEDAQVLVIVNKRGNVLSANLQGPIIINSVGLSAQQMVLADKKWSTRFEIMAAPQPQLQPQRQLAAAG